MHNNTIHATRGSILLLALFGLTACSVGADDRIVALYNSSADANRGGQLWDSWWSVVDVEEGIEPGGSIEVDPALGDTAADTGGTVTSSLEADNPYFVDHADAGNGRTGADTWRCKECHGWDYRGKDGIYGSGSHYTGFAGVTAAADKSITDSYAAIARGEIGGSTESGHAFMTVLNDQDIVDLIAFVREATLDVDAYIDPATKAVLAGDVTDGQAKFEEVCATCHGDDGTLINFKAGTYNSEYVADVASDNPWELFHKIRFGQPGEAMPNAPTNGYLLEDVASVLAYARTLGNPELNNHSAWRGGVLYDKWWKVTGGDEPTETNAVYADKTWSQGGKSGADTWRCKECHGWDYRGVDGRYGSGSHYTGIKGLYDASGKSVQSLYDAIYSGSFSDSAGTATASHDGHAFGVNGQLSEDDALDLVRFIQEALVDDNEYIDGYTTQSLGSASAGQGAFGGNCVICHGSDGTEMNFAEGDDAPAVEYPGTVARDNPWETFHKIRFGQPGSDEHEDDDAEAAGEAQHSEHMPNSLDSGYSLDDGANILAFLQTLPDSYARGGQLWDKWWDVPEVDEGITPGGSIVNADGDTVSSSIAADNPYFLANADSSNTRSGTDTWRCKECHGWDYKGVDGVYGSGSHYTGFGGVYDAHLGRDEASIYDAIANGPAGMSDSHAFLPLIGDAGVRDLTNFILDGVIDLGECFTGDKVVADYVAKDAVLRTRDANLDWGRLDFEGNCASCHGVDGQAINFDAPEWEVIGVLANDNPWEFYNKILNAQASSDPMMPSAAGKYYTLDDLMDIVSYAQTLPQE